MKVILTKDVKSLGKAGDVVEVSQGYAANFLFKKGAAKEANNTNMNELKLKNKADAKRAQEELEEAKKTAEILKSKSILVEMKSGDNGKIFGSVTNKELAIAIDAQFGVKADKRKITLSDSIKSTGNYTAKVKLHHEVTVEVKVEVKGI